MRDARSPVAQLVNFDVDSEGFEPVPSITYLTRSDLKQFLSHGIREVKRVTLLQAFPTPASNSNACIRALWTPHAVEVDMRLNNLLLSNFQAPLQQRCCTYDGPEACSRTLKVLSSDLKMEVMSQTHRFVSHIEVFSSLLMRAARCCCAALT